MSIAVAAAMLGAALPVVANADHKPGHPPPGGGGQPDLTIKATPDSTVFRRATVISGRLRGNNNSGQTVTLREDQFPYGSGATAVATTITDAQGDYSFTRRPVRNTSYRALVGAMVSPAEVVNVAIRAGLRVGDATPRVAQRVRFKGLVCPAHDGLIVRIQRRTSKGTYRTVRRARLKDAPRCSAYSRVLRIYRDGTFRLLADDADHARGLSRARFIDVHR